MPRTVRPEDSLSARFPTVAATWHPDRNSGSPVSTAAKVSDEMWWRCAAGHEWVERVATRTSLPEWKNGDVAACRVCVGYHVIVTFRCGHTTEAKAQFAEPERVCPDCRKQRRSEQDQAWQAGRTAGRSAYAGSGERAAALVAGLPAPEVPAPLAAEWLRGAVHAVRVAISAEETFARRGAVDAALQEQVRLAARLVPSRSQLEAAVAGAEPVLVAGRAHWPAGWLHQFGEPHPVGDGAGEVMVDVVREALAERAGRLVARFGRRRQLDAATVTGWLTDAVVDAATAAASRGPGGAGWRSYRELSAPLVRPGASRFSRFDVALLRPGGPDVLVEIDSTNTDRNAAKLLFARDAGALAVWVRWRAGPVVQPPGVAVIDLVEETRGLAA